jgi:hypothetical protein
MYKFYLTGSNWFNGGKSLLQQPRSSKDVVTAKICLLEANSILHVFFPKWDAPHYQGKFIVAGEPK